MTEISNSASDFAFFHECNLKGGERTILIRINNSPSPDMGLNLPPYDQKSNRKSLDCRTNNEKFLTLKCELLFQMTKQSCPSLFTLTIGFIPISINKLPCVSDEKIYTISWCYLETSSWSITLFSMALCLPYRFFLCCTKTVSSREMKLSDF